jgi:hypothetical protein
MFNNFEFLNSSVNLIIHIILDLENVKPSDECLEQGRDSDHGLLDSPLSSQFSLTNFTL